MVFELSAAVGRSPAPNESADVGIVQGLLAAYYAQPARQGVNSIRAASFVPLHYTPTVGDVIEGFQRDEKLPYKDGRIDRNGVTWKRLIAVAAALPGGLLPVPPIPPPGVLPGPAPTPPAPPDFLTRFDGIPSGFKAKSYPQLSQPHAVNQRWEVDFGAPEGGRDIDFWYYRTQPGTKVRYIGVCAPRNAVDVDAILVFYHHPIHAQHYPSDQVYLDFGVGDYMVGRMQIMRQLALSGRNVAVVVPSPVLGGWGEFGDNQDFVLKVLSRVDSDILGVDNGGTVPPLILASYSGSLEALDTVFTRLPKVARQVRAVYDFDGGIHLGLKHINLGNYAGAGAQVIRYSQGPWIDPKLKVDLDARARAFATRVPSVITMPTSRWKKHGQSANGLRADAQWMHDKMPTCMLQHGLATTRFLDAP